eukprot:gene14207-19061_t
MAKIMLISLFSVAFFSVSIRIMIGLSTYSGYNAPPMYGDFEAQRHWMEITFHLPIKEWYFQTKDNDLMYWGLDYPPLTAYVSYFFGILANMTLPDMVALKESRGYESINSKVFMRLSVIFCDIIVFIPIIILVWLYFTWYDNQTNNNDNNKNDNLQIQTFDHLHNTHNKLNSPGNDVVKIPKITRNNKKIVQNNDIKAIINANIEDDSLVIENKYISLLSFLLVPGLLLIDHGHFQYNGVCIGLAIMGVTVIITFASLWLPFCFYNNDNKNENNNKEDYECSTILLQILHRQFPFSRGIFEDKVSNIWYALSVVFDFRQLVNMQLLRMMLSLTNSSLAFFLASYQVHEKSILLCLVPLSLLIQHDPVFISWVQMLGTFTMFPLLKRDGLALPYVACIGIYLSIAMVIIANEIEGRNNDKENFNETNHIKYFRIGGIDIKPLPWWIKTGGIALSYFGMLFLHVLELVYPPPSRYPDLFPALFSLYGVANLVAIFIITLIWQWNLSIINITVNHKTINRSKKEA